EYEAGAGFDARAINQRKRVNRFTLDLQIQCDRLLIAEIAKARVDPVSVGALPALELEIGVDAEQALDVGTKLAQRREAERRIDDHPRCVARCVGLRLDHCGYGTTSSGIASAPASCSGCMRERNPLTPFGRGDPITTRSGAASRLYSSRQSAGSPRTTLNSSAISRAVAWGRTRSICDW